MKNTNLRSAPSSKSVHLPTKPKSSASKSGQKGIGSNAQYADSTYSVVKKNQSEFIKPLHK
ncbi:MAG: hypothetical protein KGI50_08175 [Patescibacteria group bacterium]|nr:hypothetical protein [Patescibacteria group bacterium]MDE2439132.1 hypothetical protein [Patescibacteria group bacterium]